MEPFDDLLAQHGFQVEDALVRAGLRGIAVAGNGRGRSLVSVVGGAVDPASLQERPGWDLPLRLAETITTDDGERTMVVEALPDGVALVRLTGPGLAGGAGGAARAAGAPAPTPVRTPAFAQSMAERFATANADGVTVGHLVPELVFVDPHSLELVGFAQRPLRADAGAAPIHGAGRLFGAAYRTPSGLKSLPGTPADDVFLLAALLWRWRHGTDPFEGPLLDRMTRTVAGQPVSGAAEGSSLDRDSLDSLLLRAFAAVPERRPSAADLAAALRA